MAKLRVCNYSMSLDGFVAGPDQGVDHPLGVGGERLHEWAFENERGRTVDGEEGVTKSIDAEFFDAGLKGAGASIIGRNMFGPIRGEWGDQDWRGWWGDDPPFHHPVFVLTHHPRAPLEMDGGTSFHFVDDPIEDVLGRAFEAADGRDVWLGGGASTIRQFLAAGLVDSLHLVVVPTLLGAGERLFEPGATEYGDLECVEYVAGERVAHFLLERRG